MEITDYMSLGAIVPGLSSKDKSGVFSELVDRMCADGLEVDREVALSALLNRESKMCTGVGHGVGMPHGFLDGLSAFRVGIGISREGIAYEAADFEPVRVVVMVFSPMGSPMEHVELLSKIVKVIARDRVVSRLCEAQSAESVMELIRTEEQKGCR